MSKQEIQYVPGFYWVAKKGNVARHGFNPDTGQVLSVRQVQNRQRAVRAELGTPKPPAIKRQGKIKTINSTKGEGTLYDYERHGNAKTLVFYNITDARNYFITQGESATKGFNQALIQVVYTKKLVANKPGSDQKRDPKHPKKEYRYATLTGYEATQEFLAGAKSTEAQLTKTHPNVWELAINKLKTDYDMSGSNARVYVYLNER